MARETLEFGEWWDDFRRVEDHREPSDVLVRLNRYFRRLSGEASVAFEQHLLELVVSRGEGWHLATGVLEKGSSPHTCVQLAAILADLEPTSLDDEDYEACLVRVLARCREPYAQELVRSFLLDWPVREYYSPWIAWPDQPDLFAKACIRYLLENPPKTIAGTLAIGVFYSRPEALDAVRREMTADDMLDLWIELVGSIRGTQPVNVSAENLERTRRIVETCTS